MDPTAGAPPPAVGVGTGSPYQVDGWSLGSTMMDMDSNTVEVDQGQQQAVPPLFPAGDLFTFQPDPEVDNLLNSLVSNLPAPPDPPITPLAPPPQPPQPPTPVRRRAPRARRGPRRIGTGTSSTSTATDTRTRRQRPYPSVTLPGFVATDDDETNQRNNQMQRRLDLLQEDQRQENEGRRIRNITHTNTVTTVYEQDPNGTPTVRRTSTQTGPGRRTRQSRSRSV